MRPLSLTISAHSNNYYDGSSIFGGIVDPSTGVKGRFFFFTDAYKIAVLDINSRSVLGFWTPPSGSGISLQDVLWEFVAFPVVDYGKREAYFPSINGKVVIVSLDDNPVGLPNTQYFTVSVGIVSRLLLTQEAPWFSVPTSESDAASAASYNMIYVGSISGLLVKWNTALRRLEAIMIMQGPIRALSFDKSVNVLFVSHDAQGMTANSNPSTAVFVRVDVAGTSLVETDRTTITESQRLIRVTNLIMQSSTSTLTAFFTTMDGSLQRGYLIYPVQCSNYTCQQCSADPYCGYCGQSATCSQKRDCPAQYWSRDVSKCPAVNTPVPASSSTAGGASVVVTGPLFYPALQASYACSFGGTDSPATAVTSTSVTCTVPARSAGAVSVSIRISGRLWAAPPGTNFLYYSCQASCGTCISASRPECGWCLSSGRCSSSGECASNFDALACPSLSLSQTSAENNPGGEALVVSVSRVIAPGIFHCIFSDSGDALIGTTTATATAGQPGSIACNSPSMAPYTGAASVTVGIYNGSVIVPYSRSTSFELYTCSVSSTPCFSCLGNHPNCRYCPGSFSCQRFNTTCSIGTLQTSCPRLESITPSAISVHELATTNLTLVGSNTTVSNATCDFGSAQRTPAYSLNGTTWICAPPAGASAGTRQVSIYTNTVQYTNPLPVELYNCSSFSTCSDCLTASHSQCVWCNDASELQCASISQLGSRCAASTGARRMSSQSECPVIQSLGRSSDSTSGGRTLSVTLSQAPTSTTATCRFGAATASGNVTGSTVHCNTPSSSIGVVPLSILIGSTVYSPSVNFTFYSCQLLETGGFRPCNQCLSAAYDACSWCDASCSATSSCLGRIFAACPRVLSVTPNFAEATGGDVIRVVVQSFPTTSRVSCVFSTGASVTGSVNENGTEIQCITPSQPVGSSTVAIYINDTTQFGDSVLPFTFSKCNELVSCGSSCFDASGICGWCVSSGLAGQCLSKLKCTTASLASPIWLNSTCVGVSTLQPDHMQILGTSSSPEVATRTVNVSMPDFANQLAWSQFNMSRLRCAFGANSSTSVLSATPNGNVVCSIPPGFSAGAVDFTVTYESRPLTQKLNFWYVDCDVVPRCRRCLTTSRCGWCANDVSCATSSTCSTSNSSATNLLWLTEECPEARTVSPSVGETTGGLQITISGRQFASGDGWTVKFDNRTEMPAQRVSDTQLTVTTPAFTRTGEVNVTVFYNGDQYVEDAVLFTFVNPLPVAAIGGGVGAAGFGIMAAVGALGFILWRRKKREAFFAELHEPDYPLIGYGEFLQPMYRTKPDLDVLAIKLLAKDRALVFALEAGTAPTEAEMMSRCLIYVFYERQKSEDLINALIANEVGRSLSEGTLFRNNSLASKEFKFFSKLVGIKYLFHSFARFIHELNRLALEEVRGTSVDANTSLIAMSMEVDPNKMREGEDESLATDANALQLSLACQKVFNMICSSIKNMPPEFLRIFQQLQHSIQTKYPDIAVVHRGIGGFLFLRLIWSVLVIFCFPPHHKIRPDLTLLSFQPCDHCAARLRSSCQSSP